MSEKLYFMDIRSTDPTYNLALEEYLLLNHTQGEILLLWQNANTIVIGRNQNTEEEINRPFVEEHGITVVRRTTGGGAVYHDMGNLNYSFIQDVGDPETMSIAALAVPVVNALATMGVTAEVSGRNDILVDGKKISGVAQRMAKNRILHHGTLLYASDPDMVAGALKVRQDKFVSKSAKSVRARIGNIRDYVTDPTMTVEVFRERLIQALTESRDVETIVLTPEEEAEIIRLRDEKYRNWDWTYGKSPAYAFKNAARFPGGRLEVEADVEQGIIRDIRFTGDFLALLEVSGAQNALKGVRFDREAVRSALAPLPIREIFGSIGPDEILQLLFDL